MLKHTNDQFYKEFDVRCLSHEDAASAITNFDMLDDLALSSISLPCQKLPYYDPAGYICRQYMKTHKFISLSRHTSFAIGLAFARGLTLFSLEDEEMPPIINSADEFNLSGLQSYLATLNDLDITQLAQKSDDLNPSLTFSLRAFMNSSGVKKSAFNYIQKSYIKRAFYTYFLLLDHNYIFGQKAFI